MSDHTIRKSIGEWFGVPKLIVRKNGLTLDLLSYLDAFISTMVKVTYGGVFSWSLLLDEKTKALINDPLNNINKLDLIKTEDGDLGTIAMLPINGSVSSRTINDLNAKGISMLISLLESPETNCPNANQIMIASVTPTTSVIENPFSYIIHIGGGSNHAQFLIKPSIGKLYADNPNYREVLFGRPFAAKYPMIDFVGPFSEAILEKNEETLWYFEKLGRDLITAFSKLFIEESL